MPLFLYNTGKWNGRRVKWEANLSHYFYEETPDEQHDGKDMRDLANVYQLDKSQLVFSVVEMIGRNNYMPCVYETTSAYSTIIAAETSASRNLDAEVHCMPREGDWRGGDEVMMLVPRLDRRKGEFLPNKRSIDVDVWII
jgi:hypothetical protein